MSDINNDLRIVQIIDLARKKSYISLDYMAESIGVSTRTIRNYIKQLNTDWNSTAELVNERGKGFHLIINDQQLFDDYLEELNKEKILQDSPQKRLASIIDCLLNNETITLDEIALRLNIGRTTLVNELKKATVSLESYSLSILGKQNEGMHLTGNELSLRFFILDNVFDYLYGDYPLDEDIKEELTNVIDQYDLEFTTQSRLMQSITIMLDRLLKGHSIVQIEDKYQALLESNDFQIATELAKVIEKGLPINIPIQEVLFITLPIVGRRTPTNNRTMADIKITEEINNLLERIIEQLGFRKEIIHEKEEFFKDLQYHITFMLNRLMFNIRLRNPLLDDVKQKYPLAYKMAEVAGKVIKEEYGLAVSEDELGYLAFYFSVYIAQNEVQVRKLKKVAVICGTGRGTSKLISIQLQRVLQQNTEIDLFSDKEVTKDLLRVYDIVFSTVKLSFETDAPLIMINEIFDESTISREIEKVTYLQKFKLRDIGNSNSILKLLTNKDKVFILDNKQTYHKNVEMMINQLTKLNFLDAGFKERLIKREEKGSMIFDKYIALPHTVNYQSNKLEIALGIFPKKIQESGKEIKLIFLLGIPNQTDNDDNLIVKIYEEIIQLASNDQLVQKIAESKNYEEVSNYLEEINNK
ncbi:BglG family transcription antiterminator [Niallia nealsonii]|uniref:Transcriptional antiterminator BglG n=1 Tax=Niallia nealsonii TaxID=115979 RepID=A0A2N0Z7P0_9BACI|nr:PRD domain-containing protein [Niallia nealsonii]PKG25528.1 transcriptional antiterminator BglG [Niallia nealsonii]